MKAVPFTTSIALCHPLSPLHRPLSPPVVPRCSCFSPAAPLLPTVASCYPSDAPAAPVTSCYSTVTPLVTPLSTPGASCYASVAPLLPFSHPLLSLCRPLVAHLSPSDTPCCLWLPLCGPLLPQAPSIWPHHPSVQWFGLCDVRERADRHQRPRGLQQLPSVWSAAPQGRDAEVGGPDCATFTFININITIIDHYVSRMKLMDCITFIRHFKS